VEVVAAGLRITPERRAARDFSRVFMQMPARFVTLARTETGNVTPGKALNSSAFWISETRLSYRSRP
jgi:hypothetical protein